MPEPAVKLVVALPAEARPIIARFRLKRVQSDLGFPLYRGGRTALVVTGVGKLKAAAGTAFLGALDSRPQRAIWVNVGIAGHAERPIGEVLLASRITDPDSGRVRRPILPENRPCPADHLLTLNQPDTSYRRKGMLDMEAGGFFPVACRYTDSALVQVLKVISDNPETGIRTLSAKRISLLIADALETLEVLITNLDALPKGKHKTPSP